jgi:hypothetical protein
MMELLFHQRDAASICSEFEEIKPAYWHIRIFPAEVIRALSAATKQTAPKLALRGRWKPNAAG